MSQAHSCAFLLSASSASPPLRSGKRQAQRALCCNAGSPAQVQELKEKHSIVPGLVTILVGANPASQSYIRSKNKTATDLGFESVQVPSCRPDLVWVDFSRVRGRSQAHHTLRIYCGGLLHRGFPSRLAKGRKDSSACITVRSIFALRRGQPGRPQCATRMLDSLVLAHTSQATPRSRKEHNAHSLALSVPFPIVSRGCSCHGALPRSLWGLLATRKKSLGRQVLGLQLSVSGAFYGLLEWEHLGMVHRCLTTNSGRGALK